MTALNIGTDIPTNIDTLEKLALWAVLSLNSVNRQRLYKETDDPNGTVPLASAGVVESADGTDRFIGRLAIQLDPDWRVSTNGKFWMNALPFQDVALPDAYKTN